MNFIWNLYFIGTSTNGNRNQKSSYLWTWVLTGKKQVEYFWSDKDVPYLNLVITLMYNWFSSIQFSHSVMSDSFAIPWTAACQASLSVTSSRSLLKLMSIESVMPSNHLILCRPLSPPIFNLSQHQGLFQWVSSSHQVAIVLEFQLQHQSFQWIFRTDFL